MKLQFVKYQGTGNDFIIADNRKGEYSLSTMTHQIEMESSGHFPMIDEATRFNRLLTDFLALDSGVSPRELQVKDEWRRRVR